MSELIVSYLVQSQHGKPHGQRIFADGKAEDYRVTRLVRAADGSYQDEQVTPGWYPVTDLNEAQIEAVKQAVEASGLPRLPSEISGKDSGSTAKREAEWQVTTDDGIRTIHVAPWPPGGDTGQALFTLTQRLNEIVREALA
jgi:hypothetical protein